MSPRESFLNAEEKLRAARTRFLLDQPFFGFLAIGLELCEQEAVGTMATDGVRLFYSAEFVQNCSMKHLQGALAHEVLHCALGHLWRRQGRAEDRWNVAADHATNLLLIQCGFELPQYVLKDRAFTDMSVERIYDLLPENYQEKMKEGGQKLFDSHDPWNQSQSREESVQQYDSQNEEPTAAHGREEGDGEGYTSPLPGLGPQPQLEQEWKERLVAARNFAKIHSNMPSQIERLIEDLLTPKLNWREILCAEVFQAARSDFRLFPPNKRHLWRGMYLPSMSGDTLEIAVGVDTSGSISKREFQEFLAEIRGITEQFTDYTLHLFFCDARVHTEVTLTSQDAWPDSFKKADGGTSFVPVFEAIEKNQLAITTLLYLTDGYGTFPQYEPPYPVIWLLNSSGDVPWGQLVRMEE